MRNVDIEIFCTAQTKVNKMEVKRWLKSIGAENFDVPTEGACTDPALMIALAAKRCYMSFEPGLNPNVTKVRKDLTEYLDNVLKSGHGSVLEHACYTFAIENVSRVFTAEMTLTENDEWAFNKVADWAGMTQDEKNDQHNYEPTAADERDAEIAHKKIRTKAVFNRHFRITEEHYAELQDIWKDELAPESKFHGKKQVTSMIRRIIPMGVATGGVWTMNLRAVRHIIALRSTDGAEEEIAYVFGKIAKYITEQEPMLMGDFTQDEHGFWTPKYKKV